jgi:hypothetical protein
VASDARGRQTFQRAAGHARDPPVGQDDGTERFVEADRALVPVEDRPLETTALAVAGNRRERGEKRFPNAVAAVLGPDEEIFEPQRAAAQKRRKSMEK